MDEADQPRVEQAPAPRARDIKRGRKPPTAMRLRVLAATAAIATLFLAPGIIERVREPVYENRRIGEWFGDLCLGTRFSRVPDSQLIERMSRAATAFTRMDSNAVPFLVKKLRTPSSALSEKAIKAGRKIPVAAHVFKRLQTPTEQRIYAATALKFVGPQAVSAIPALLAALDAETNPTIAQIMVAALGRASGLGENLGDIDYDRDAVLRHVRSRYPHLFPSMGAPPVATNKSTIPEIHDQK
jgi:hypothetical protein